MTIERNGERFVGSTREDIGPYVEAATEGAEPVGAFRLAQCLCGSARFRVETQAEAARRTCTACKLDYALGEPGPEASACSCPACGSGALNVGVGLALRPGTEDATHLHLGVRCAKCGTLGLAGGWSIEDTPSGPLLDGIGPAPRDRPS